MLAFGLILAEARLRRYNQVIRDCIGFCHCRGCHQGICNYRHPLTTSNAELEGGEMLKQLIEGRAEVGPWAGLRARVICHRYLSV